LTKALTASQQVKAAPVEKAKEKVENKKEEAPAV
jgi:hypothetical protein